MKNKIKQKIINCYMKFVNNALLLQSEVKNTNFTKKIPKAIIAVCGVALMEIATPITAFADDGTESIDTFVTAIGKWLVKIGIVVAMVGGVMFALGWQREDSEGKSRGLLTVMAGFMVAAIGASPAAFGFK